MLFCSLSNQLKPFFQYDTYHTCRGYLLHYMTMCNENVFCPVDTRVGTLIVATIYLQLIQNRYMF